MDDKLNKQWIQLNGLTICYRVREGRSAPLLILNGIGASLELASPVIDALEDREIIIFDMPGVGGSSKLAWPCRLSYYATLTATLLQKLNYQSVDVLGVSWGGALLQQFAKQYPAYCRKLILAATSPTSFLLPHQMNIITKMISPKRYQSSSYLLKVAPDIYGGMLRANPELAKVWFSVTKSPTSTGYFYQLLACMGWTSTAWLTKLDMPVLILAGNDDPLVPIANARLMNQLLPNSILEEIDDGHLFLLSQPEVMAAKIEAFLD